MSPAKRGRVSSKKSKASKKSKSSAKPAASARKKKGGSGLLTSPWIGFLHPTGLEPAQEDAFLDALGTTYAADPLEPVNAREVVYIRWVHGRGRYARANIANLKRSVTNLVGTPGGLGVLITGSSIAAKAAQAITPNALPVLAVIGRQGMPLKNSIGGYYLSDQGNASLREKITILGRDYGVGTAATPDVSRMCLLYNGNSEMSVDELTAWNAVTTNLGKSVNAAQGVGNDGINLRQAFQQAAAVVGAGGAIIISSDPFFTTRRSRIIKRGVASTRIMCYPLIEYFDEAQDESPPGSFFCYGPNLTDVYRDIGTWAVNILSGADAPPFTVLPATLTYRNG